MTKSAAKPLFDAIRDILARAEETQSEALRKAARLIADSLTADGILHVFGTGHSHMMAEEAFLRAGGLAQVNAILDPGLMLHLSALGSVSLERLCDYTPFVLDRYDIRPGDVMLIVSNSGRNAGPIEAALYAHKRGLPVIVFTSAQSYQALAVRHPSGKHLTEIADVFIDTGVPEGDAAVIYPGLTEHICPVSTIIGAALVEALVYEVVDEIMQRGQSPNILVSANVDSSNSLEASLSSFRTRIRHL
jgi:uncharacterized phosphosugar-binding protein